VPLPGGLLQLGWLLPGAFVGLWFLIRRDKREAIPFAALLLVVLFVVLLFWYSPRYRLPVAPIAALLAPFGVYALAASFQRQRSWLLLAVFAILPGAALEGWSLASGFDPLEDSRAQFELNAGLNFIHQEQFREAIPRFQAALALDLETADIHTGLAEAQVKIGTEFLQKEDYAQADALYLQAIQHYQRATEINPTKLDTWFSLVSVLEYMKRPEEALAAVELALQEAAKQEPSALIERLKQMRARLLQSR
jgi:tetratricopeptide (TPR) repeat protein